MSSNMKSISLLILILSIVFAESTANRISKQKCQEYNELLKKKNICNEGEISNEGNYPFVGALGFADEKEDGKIRWACSAALISDQFALSVAHCTSDREFGTVKYLRLGLTEPFNNNSNAAIHEINEIIRHPGFKYPSAYNDIALFKLKKPIEFTKYMQPACIYTGQDLNKYNVAGFTFYDRRQADFIEPLLVHQSNDVASKEQCNEEWTPMRLLKEGVKFDTQFCNKEGSVSCEINSGGLFLHEDENLKCIQNVAGLIAKGKGICTGHTGLNIKIAGFAEWIERIVWP